MDDFLFIGLLILVFIGVPTAIGLLLYFIPKKLGYPKTGKVLTIIFGITIIILAGIIFFEDELFSKREARKLIEEQDIFLHDDFILKDNKSMWAPGDYYHTFTLIISNDDKDKAIDKIKASNEYKKLGQPIRDLVYETHRRHEGPKVTQNYETENEYIREYLKPNGKEYAPTFRRIRIDKKESKLIFEDIVL